MDQFKYNFDNKCVSNDTVTITSTGTSGSVSEGPKTISVSGQDDVVVDGGLSDTLTIDGWYWYDSSYYGSIRYYNI